MMPQARSHEGTPFADLDFSTPGVDFTTTGIPILFKGALKLPQVAEYTTRIRQFGDIAKAADRIIQSWLDDDLFELIEGLRDLGIAYADLSTGPTTLVLGVAGPEAGFPGQSAMLAPPVIKLKGMLKEQAQVIMAASTVFDLFPFHNEENNMGVGQPEKLWKAILPDIPKHGILKSEENKKAFYKVANDPSIDMTTAGGLIFQELKLLNERFNKAYEILAVGIREIEFAGNIKIPEAGKLISDMFNAIKKDFEGILKKNNEVFDGPLRITDEDVAFLDKLGLGDQA